MCGRMGQGEVSRVHTSDLYGPIRLNSALERYKKGCGSVIRAFCWSQRELSTEAACSRFRLVASAMLASAIPLFN